VPPLGVDGVAVPPLPPLGADGAVPPLDPPVLGLEPESSVVSVESVESVESVVSSDDEVDPLGGGSGSVAGELVSFESSPPPGMIATMMIRSRIAPTIAAIRRRQ
jgi:hypothetical protein